MVGAQTQGSNQSGWAQSAPQIAPWMIPTNNQLVQTISQMMLGPNNPAIKQMQTTSANDVNQSYSAMPRTIAARLSGLGFGKSGKLGTAMYNTEASRLNTLGDLNSQFGQMGLNEENTGSSLAEQLLRSTMGNITQGGGTSYGVGSKITV